MSKKVQATMKATKFKDCQIVAVAACPGENEEPVGISDLMNTLITSSFVPQRNNQGSLLFAVDHCFAIKGQGTVMTGTVLQGSVKVNDVS
jgi:selenocysteine-specific elongation factor